MITNLPLALFENYIEIAEHYLLIILLSDGQWVIDHPQYTKFLNKNREFFIPKRKDHKKMAAIFKKANFKMINYRTKTDTISQGMLMEPPILEIEAKK